MSHKSLNFLASIDTSKEENRLVKVDLVTPSEVTRFNEEFNQPKIRAAVFEIDREQMVIKRSSGNVTIEKQLVGEEALSAIKDSTDESFKTRMSFMTDEQRQRNFDSIIGSVGESKNVGFYSPITKQLIGFIQMRKQVFQNETHTLISWVWIRSGTKLEEKKGIYESVRFLISTADLPQIVASVHTDNQPSFKFFERLGFKIKWVYVM